MKTFTRLSAIFLSIGLLAAPAFAGDDEGDETTSEDHGGSGGADPATKTLPDSASDTAKANAFGQQGERMRAAHAAAREAAAAEAATEHGRPASPGSSAGRARGPATQSDTGRARAAAAADAGRARAAEARAAHPPKGPRS